MQLQPCPEQDPQESGLTTEVAAAKNLGRSISDSSVLTEGRAPILFCGPSSAVVGESLPCHLAQKDGGGGDIGVPPFFFSFSFLNSDSLLWEGLSFICRLNFFFFTISMRFLRYKRDFVFLKDKQGDGSESWVPLPRVKAKGAVCSDADPNRSAPEGPTHLPTWAALAQLCFRS